MCSVAFRRAVWETVEDAVKLAVDFLSANLGVRIYDFVPYPSMIVEIDYSMLFRWFIGLNLDGEVWLTSDEHFTVDGTLLEA